MKWLFTPIPRGEPEVLESSIGLYVQGALSQSNEYVCLVRYDVDNQGVGTSLMPRGPHLNLIQPGHLSDKVHYQIPKLEGDGWSVNDVLEVLLSDQLKQDVVGCFAGKRRRRGGSR